MAVYPMKQTEKLKGQAVEVLRQFISDVTAAHTVEGGELDRAQLEEDWFDIAVTYDKAVAVIEALDTLARPVSPKPKPRKARRAKAQTRSRR